MCGVEIIQCHGLWFVTHNIKQATARLHSVAQIVWGSMKRLWNRLGKVRRFWPGPDMARLAQSVERKALNLVVVGSSPTVGDAWRVMPLGNCNERGHTRI